MNSQTKNKQTQEILNQMTIKAFPELTIKNINELKEGYFNIAYLIELSNSEEVILKIAPTQNSLIMTHEKNIMFSEVDSMRMVANKLNVPVAKLLFYDNSHSPCDADYFFMEKLEGDSFSSVMSNLPEDDKKNIQFQLGRYNKELNNITNNKFGYYGQADKQGNNWYEVFKSMIGDTINDARKLNIDQKVDSKVIFELLEKDKEIFEEVTTPKFVHWDLWAGNVFVKDGNITGLIDFERCMWADELLEVGFRTYGYDENFFRGYGITELTENQKRRAKWYDIYLFLICSLECDYRFYDTRDTYEWATGMLIQWVEEMAV
jgi:fructosamine-3-kinase